MLITDVVLLLNFLIIAIGIYGIIVLTRFANLGIKALKIYISKNSK